MEQLRMSNLLREGKTGELPVLAGGNPLRYAENKFKPWRREERGKGFRGVGVASGLRWIESKQTVAMLCNVMFQFLEAWGIVTLGWSWVKWFAAEILKERLVKY
ncbi:hypothetical protein CEXT_677901 [Caerostris extrusa]|uniref:Uncharacterized protein n=1 Tax=Caerostris extrusa TaxID=172846 RepID=A0AAV4UBD5_CAEEX|nr:hypothetical protein CEXT_677901 [Caerostris extrusa]